MVFEEIKKVENFHGLSIDTRSIKKGNLFLTIKGKKDDGIKFIKSGSLDESSWIEVTSNYWTSSANKWSKVDETITCFKQNPEF